MSNWLGNHKATDFVRLRKTAIRILASLVSILCFAGSAHTWVFEVSRNNWKFDHSMRFAITSILVGVFFAFIAIRGEIPKINKP